MRLKGKLVQWNNTKAFGFIAPNGNGDDVFIHKTAFANRQRTPQINDVITFSVVQDKQGRHCANDAAYSGEKLRKKTVKHISNFSLFLAIIFLTVLLVAMTLEYLPRNLVLIYFLASFMAFIAYTIDKSKARRGTWRTPESTLHLLALVGGWPGAAIAQQILRHKSQKRTFRIVFWLTVIINVSTIVWLLSSYRVDFQVLL